jgi:hypothetical protein
MPRTLFILLSVGLSFVSASAQNYQRALLVKTEGDSLRGYVDFGDWDVHPNSISYVRSINSEKVEKFLPIDVKSFNFGKKEYIGATVTVKESRDEERVDKVFMETLVFGEKPLYYYKDKLGVKRFYINNENGVISELVYGEQKKVYNDGMEVKVKNNLYQDQLLAYLGSCPKIKSKIKSSSYTVTSMLSIFDQYYSCTKEAVGYMTKPDKISIEWFAVVGASLTDIKLQATDGFEFLRGSVIPLSIRPTIGAAFNVILPRTSKKWSIYNEVNYSQFSFNYKSSRQSTLSLVEYDSKLSPAYLKLISMIEYKTSADKSINIHFAGGISNAQYIGGENNLITFIKSSPNGTSTKEGKLLDPIRSTEHGIVGSAKISKGPYGLRYSINRTLGFSPFISLNAPITWHYLTLNYQI